MSDLFFVPVEHMRRLLARIARVPRAVAYVVHNFFRASDLQDGICEPATTIRVAAIVPCYRPEALTIALVQDLIAYNPGIHVCVVDDCTPVAYEKEHKIFEKIRALDGDVRVCRTPENKLKAGALNHGIQKVLHDKKRETPDVIITLDDDVVINKDTIRALVCTLRADERVGAACTHSRVLNKSTNILTRLQGLEYLGFSAVRTADESFFNGPLVMPGMLTALRVNALRQVGLFAENHLLEDYEITARLKAGGWRVRLAIHALAWTQVPDTFVGLWKQRARWMNGGLPIVAKRQYWRAVPQDLIGHALFFATILLIVVALIVGGVHAQEGEISWVGLSIIFLSLCQAIMLYAFQLWYMRYYAERDRYDILLRASLIPEFIYANILTLTLVGAYLFRLFEWVVLLLPRGRAVTQSIVGSVRSAFARLGYTKGWGTRDA